MPSIAAQAAFPTWHPHLDVWAVLFILGFGYAYAVRRIGPHLRLRDPVVTRRQALAFAAGLFLLWVVSGWPLHDIAEQHLFMFHMVEHIVLGLVVPPLLLVGTPVWILRALLANRFVLPVLRPLVVPVVAFFLFDLTFVGIHWPAAINLMVSTPPRPFRNPRSAVRRLNRHVAPGSQHRPRATAALTARPNALSLRPLHTPDGACIISHIR